MKGEVDRVCTASNQRSQSRFSPTSRLFNIGLPNATPPLVSLTLKESQQFDRGLNWTCPQKDRPSFDACPAFALSSGTLRGNPVTSNICSRDN